MIQTGILHDIAMYENTYDSCHGNIASKNLSNIRVWQKRNVESNWSATSDKEHTKSCRSRLHTWETRVCLTMFDYVWPCLTMFDYVVHPWHVYQSVYPTTMTGISKCAVNGTGHKMRYDVTSGNFRIPILLAEKSSVQERKVCQLHHIGILRRRRRIPWKGEGWQVFAQRILASKRMRGSGWDVPISLMIHYCRTLFTIYDTILYIFTLQTAFIYTSSHTQTGIDSIGANSGASKLCDIAVRHSVPTIQVNHNETRNGMNIGCLLQHLHPVNHHFTFYHFLPAINDGYTTVYHGRLDSQTYHDISTSPWRSNGGPTKGAQHGAAPEVNGTSATFAERSSRWKTLRARNVSAVPPVPGLDVLTMCYDGPKEFWINLDHFGLYIDRLYCRCLCYGLV